MTAHTPITIQGSWIVEIHGEFESHQHRVEYVIAETTVLEAIDTAVRSWVEEICPDPDGAGDIWDAKILGVSARPALLRVKSGSTAA